MHDYADLYNKHSYINTHRRAYRENERKKDLKANMSAISPYISERSSKRVINRVMMVTQSWFCTKRLCQPCKCRSPDAYVWCVHLCVSAAAAYPFLPLYTPMTLLKPYNNAVYTQASTTGRSKRSEHLNRIAETLSSSSLSSQVC